ncbi:hypothetical protein VOLCADRAFT_65498 [Volvox carteri f. nagariensis]|uniref:Tryptophan synthase beta chain-like PALP domain-containing protein n=1 Tax=Volvox carteri f. nagariensis TaxID=3068 RepID=D8U8Z6_VOLCA|nr:uncharacterized protein VOLCADRAFT_65498 [Volvox carteri f. nagariensis]EFJ43893.1 hypothetical protein VOLCADRAFT_65498 [Volvox carteri f. nagariensis]|eukprot:XP_002955139.1 hypothetical protein VOLCADRAFT_65498 [Volvox carteri f. nagariensis]
MKGWQSQAAAAASGATPPPASTSFLQLEPYSPPTWASHIPLVPTHRFRLGILPTPIHEWRLPGLPEGVRVLIKRDDLSGMQMSGNKVVRKLEFLMAEAVQGGYDCVVTIGGIQSNHARATAVAARYLGLDCHLILRTSRQLVDSDPGLVGNLLVERLAGAQLHLVTKEEYATLGSGALLEQLRSDLKSTGRKPYIIPVGGSNSLGVWGYLESSQQLKYLLQLGGDDPAAPMITDIAMACGSGGTTAGLALGSALSPLGGRVLAFGVCDTPEYFYDYIDGLLGGLGAAPGGELLGGRRARDLLYVIQARGAGYAISTEAELRTVQEVAAATGVVLDPVYSGKAVHALLADIRARAEEWRGRTVLFVHTGGLLGMYDKLDQLEPLVQAHGAPAVRLQVRQPNAQP